MKYAPKIVLAATVALLCCATWAFAFASAGSAPNPVPQAINGSNAILFIALPGELPDGNVAVLADVSVNEQGEPVLVFSSAPHGIYSGCPYEARDFFGYGSGGDWGGYTEDYVVYTVHARSWIRQALSASGWSAPDCSR